MIPKFLVDFLFPSHCLVENSIIKESRSKFISQRSFDRFPLCDHSEIITNRLRRSSNFSTSIESLYSLLDLKEDNRYSDLIHYFKYSSYTEIGNELTYLLFEKITREAIPKIDLIIPIPLHKARQRERSYNQSELIAFELGKYMNVGIDIENITRKKFTSTQTKLIHDKRKLNINTAFHLSSSLEIKGKNLLIVDDVITSGATISALSDLLKTKKPENIYAASLAIAF